MNKQSVANIVSLLPQGTNSTFFTECCQVAICDYQKVCPHCKGLVIGHDALTEHARRMIRFENATRFWKKTP